ncbi:MAG: hypothetical protein CM1200mP20_08020 [Pseudomonadota bacterium]|nr:MAG: hypothetical protein CM1200mP20_08020 [Pseudomonadota bacterium]
MRLNAVTLRGWVNAAVIVVLALVPVIVNLTDNAFFLDLATRFVILAIAAVSLNLILGYGRMISFGHAAYIGIGAYAVGIPAYYEIYNGYLHILIAMSVSAVFALETRPRVPQNPRRELHHDHDGLCPNGVLRIRLHRGVRR